MCLCFDMGCLDLDLGQDYRQYSFGPGLVLRVLYQSNFRLLGSASQFDGSFRVTTALDEPIFTGLLSANPMNTFRSLRAGDSLD